MCWQLSRIEFRGFGHLDRIGTIEVFDRGMLNILSCSYFFFVLCISVKSLFFMCHRKTNNSYWFSLKSSSVPLCGFNFYCTSSYVVKFVKLIFLFHSLLKLNFSPDSIQIHFIWVTQSYFWGWLGHQWPTMIRFDFTQVCCTITSACQPSCVQRHVTGCIHNFFHTLWMPPEPAVWLMLERRAVTIMHGMV